jgi:hypothetical protein
MMRPAIIEQAALLAVVGGRVTPAQQVPKACQDALAQILQVCQGLQQQKAGELDMWNQMFGFMKQMKEKREGGGDRSESRDRPPPKAKGKG